MTPKTSLNWRTLVLIVSLVLSISGTILGCLALQRPALPDWVELAEGEGPAAFGIDKFYRNAYFKGDLQTAGDMMVGGYLDVTGVVTTGSTSLVTATITTATIGDATITTSDVATETVGYLTLSGGVITATSATIGDATISTGLVETFLTLGQATVIDLADGGIITPTASYQPLTVDAAGTITTGNPSIADGTITGTVLILVNEDDQDIVIVDGQNTKSGGNLTLTANADDSAMFVWDGADWICLTFHDN